MLIDHINIVVSNMERSLAFYEGVLGLKRGFEATLEGPWIEKVTGLADVKAKCVFMESPGGGARFELLEYRSPAGVSAPETAWPHTLGVRHVAFLVDDMETLLERLKDAGVPLISEPVEVPFSVGAMGRKRLCYFRDPDGVLLEAAAYEG